MARPSPALGASADPGEEPKCRIRDVAARAGFWWDRAGVRLWTDNTNAVGRVRTIEADAMTHRSRRIGVTGESPAKAIPDIAAAR